MTPTEAYRAAMEAAASYTASTWFLEDRGRKEMGQSPLGEHIATIIRSLPGPEGLKGPRCILCGREDQKCHCWDRAGDPDNTTADEIDSLRAENERLRGMSPGVAAIATERQRQIAKEGWTAEHDDAHVRGELGAAAACYAVPSRHRLFAVANFWPSTWGHEWWKPSGAHDDIEARRRDLVKAGALIAAEIDRLDRAALKGGE